ncbi:hypothetical protein BC828DRAFT_409642 [Blastocladiella britannica]|nr:hypothetical protein BC828DRAFT_409642 [Blastocladiella britannica]
MGPVSHWSTLEAHEPLWWIGSSHQEHIVPIAHAAQIAAMQCVLDLLLHTLLYLTCGLVMLRVDCATLQAPSTSCWALTSMVMVVSMWVVVQQHDNLPEI